MKKNKTLLSNFILAFIIIIVIPTFFINTFLYSTLKKKAIAKHVTMMASNMEYISKNIENELRRLKLKTAMLVADRDVLDLLYRWHLEESEILKEEYSHDLQGYITRRYDFLSEIESAYFFLENKGLYSYNSTVDIDDVFIRNQNWYKKARNLYTVGSIESLGGSFEDGSRENVFTIVSGMDSLVSSNFTEEPLELAVIQFKNQLFEGIYSDFEDTYMGEVIIFDELGNVRLTSNSNFLRNTINDFPEIAELAKIKDKAIGVKSQSNNYISSIYTTPKSRWLVVNRSNYKAITKSISEQLFMFNSSFIILIVLFSLFSVFFFRRVVESIKYLIVKMKQAEKGNFKEGISKNGYGEVYELECAFDNMIKEINLLMIERDIKDREKREEEIKALQAQINPHFIYNTLNCVRIMSMISHQDNITDLTDAFMTLLSGMFKDSNMIIPIKKELSYLENYIYIMKVRFGNTFKVIWDIESEAEECGILKLVLQPLVENAITHGVSQKESGGEIFIKARVLDDFLLFQVEDNGPGIDKKRINDLLEGNEEDEKGLNKVGVNNVQRRIRLNYGDEYGLSIESEADLYTRIYLKIPLIKNN